MKKSCYRLTPSRASQGQRPISKRSMRSQCRNVPNPVAVARARANLDKKLLRNENMCHLPCVSAWINLTQTCETSRDTTFFLWVLLKIVDLKPHEATSSQANICRAWPVDSKLPGKGTCTGVPERLIYYCMSLGLLSCAVIEFCKTLSNESNDVK